MTTPPAPRREPPVSLRMSKRLRAWYEARARNEGTSPHALMLRALARYVETTGTEGKDAA